MLARVSFHGDPPAARVQGPLDRGGDVRRVVVEPREGEVGVGSVEPVRRRLHPRREVAGQQLAAADQVGVRQQLRPREGPDGAEHHEPHLDATLHRPHQPRIDDGGEPLDHRRDVETDGLDRLDGEAALEQRETVAHQARLGVQAVVAPRGSRWPWGRSTTGRARLSQLVDDAVQAAQPHPRRRPARSRAAARRAARTASATACSWPSRTNVRLGRGGPVRRTAARTRRHRSSPRPRSCSGTSSGGTGSTRSPAARERQPARHQEGQRLGRARAGCARGPRRPRAPPGCRARPARDAPVRARPGSRAGRRRRCVPATAPRRRPAGPRGWPR